MNGAKKIVFGIVSIMLIAAVGAAERAWLGKISRTDPALHEAWSPAAAAPMPWLRVEGKRIHNEHGESVRLGGVALLVPDDPAWSEYPMHGTKLLKYYADLGCNAIRISFSVTDGEDFARYVEEMLDPLVRAAAAARCYLILDMHEYKYGALENGNKIPKENFEELLIERWKMLAGRYKDEPAVAAYELWNEPDIEDGGRQSVRVHREYMTRLLREVRAIDSRHMLIVNGVLGGFGPTTALTWGANYRYDGGKIMAQERSWLESSGITPQYDAGVPAIAFAEPEKWEHPDPARNTIFAFHCGYFLVNVQNAELEYHVANHRNILTHFADALNVPILCTEWECEPPDTASEEFMRATADWFGEDPNVVGWLVWRVHFTREYLDKYFKEFAQGGFVRPGELDPAYADIWLPLTIQRCRRPGVEPTHDK